jgi:hypothetical protein
MTERKWHNLVAHPYTLPDQLVTFAYGPFAHVQSRQEISITLLAGGKMYVSRIVSFSNAAQLLLRWGYAPNF